MNHKAIYSLLLGALLLAIFAVCPSLLHAQAVSGDLVGGVSDPMGAMIPMATVTAQNDATGVKYTAMTDSQGAYRFSNLPVGTYTVTATATGFSTATVKDVAVQLNNTVTENLSLAVGTTSTTVEVTAAAAPIDTTTYQVQNTFETREILDLPQAAFSGGAIATTSAANAGIANLSLLNAGVTNPTGSGYGTGPSIGGQRPTNNSYNVEGIDNNDKGVTGPVVYTPIDAIGEFTILQNQFNPEFGFTSGGVFNVGIKSGTNAIHGSIYEYVQNRDFNAIDQQNARQGFTTTNPRYDDNRLGGDIGGPIKKNKLFYFADFEYNPLGQAPTPANVINAPTAAGYSALAAIPGISATNLKVLQQYLPAAPAANGTTQVGGLNIPIGPLSISGPAFSNQYNLATAGDYDISDKDQLRLRYIYNKYSSIDTTANLPVFWGDEVNNVHLATLSEYHNFGPTAINEFRLSFSRRYNTYTIPNQTFPGLGVFPNIMIENDLNLQLGPDPNDPQGYIQDIYQLTDNYTKTVGRHTIKIGYDVHDIIATNTFVQRARGDYDYSDLNQYLFDLAPDYGDQRSVGAAAGGYPVGFVQQGAYVNDDFRFRSNLTLNLGIRYEYVTVPVASRAQALNAIADVPGVITFNAPKSQTTNWAPRVGFAYSPGTSAKTSIRGGFGIAYDQFYNNLATNEVPPYYQTTISPSLTSNAPGFLAGGAIPDIPPAPTTNPMIAREQTASLTSNQIRPYSINWNFGVQHVFHQDYTLEVRYIGTRGVHLWVQDQPFTTSVVTPTNSLPTFLSMPSVAQLSALPLTLGALKAVPYNSLAQYGFPTITSYQPIGESMYNGLDVQLTRRFSRGLSMIAAYTWSHALDDATDTVNATAITPRRPENFQNIMADWGNSLLDHRHRFTLTADYDTPWFKSSGNWFMKNLVGNWVVAGTYTYQSPEWATVQSGVDSNLNNDALDRAIVNPAGQANVGSGVIPLAANGSVVAAGSANIVAYVAQNPNARYIQAGLGAYANGGRDTFPMLPIDNIDASLTKRFNVSERVRLQFSGQFYNLLNHPQYIPGFVSDVTPESYTGEGRNFLLPQNPAFGDFSEFFPSNSRTIQIVGKIIF